VWSNPDGVATILLLYFVSHYYWLPWISNMTTQCTLWRMMGAEILNSWKGSIHVHRQWHEWHKCLGAHQHCQLSRIASKNTLKRNTAMLCWPGRCKILSCFPGCASTPKLWTQS
jgi:hypothetical protein